MAANQFHLPTHWRVEAPIERVAAILSRPAEFPRWWGDVYLAVEAGGPDGVGGWARVHSRGWLPYHLHWTGTLTEDARPHRWAISATGDLTGRGVWTLAQDGAWADIHYDWRVAADRPLFRYLAPLFAPVMASNHRWAMAKGLEGLKRELSGGPG
jgi:hypothetical protein